MYFIQRTIGCENLMSYSVLSTVKRFAFGIMDVQLNILY